MTTISRVVMLVDVTCYSCALLFAVPVEWQAARLRDGVDFWCPNGHRQAYTETEADRLRKELATATRRAERAEGRAIHYRDQADAEERSHRATRGHLTRLKTRVANGVCPCCHRTFVNLARHMGTKHPNYEQAGG